MIVRALKVYYLTFRVGCQKTQTNKKRVSFNNNNIQNILTT